MPHWYEDTPTVWTHNGVTDYINFADNAPIPKEWKDRAKVKDGWPFVATRAAVQPVLTKATVEDIAAAKFAAATLDVAAPVIGTADQKATAVSDKLATVISVAEYEKLVKLKEAIFVKDDGKPIKDVIDLPPIVKKG